MLDRRTHAGLGLGALIAAALLAFAAIPAFVSAPSNVRNVVLSPTFWPYCLAGLTAVAGLGLLLTSRRLGDAPAEDRPPDGALGLLRLAGMAALMVGYLFALTRLGMVWSSMLAFAATAFLVRTRHWKTAIVCAVAIPLILYAFFAHVAGVAIPQGALVRLP